VTAVVVVVGRVVGTIGGNVVEGRVGRVGSVGNVGSVGQVGSDVIDA
jgi:hypothetical protein